MSEVISVLREVFNGGGGRWHAAAAILLGILGMSLWAGAPAAEPVSGAKGGLAAQSQTPADEPLKLGMPYVVPPHVPGSKVRTPEGLAPLLAERLGKTRPVEPVALPASHASALLLPLNAEEAAAHDGVVIPTGYRAGIMAIMRTDTDIKQWEDLRGRTVCLAEGSGLAGSMQARYGAVEKVFRAPADALLDLRIGGCDATVHDSTMLHALLEFPEWQKFSARLPVQDERELSFVVPASDTQLTGELQAQVAAWHDEALLSKLTKQSARDIAFEVYLDQEVPDCH